MANVSELSKTIVTPIATSFAMDPAAIQAMDNFYAWLIVRCARSLSETFSLAHGTSMVIADFAVFLLAEIAVFSIGCWIGKRKAHLALDYSMGRQ